jgi:hypothetical protein
VFDDAISRIPRRAAKATDRELLAIRSARRQGGRRTEAGRPHKARTGAGSRG